MRIRTPFAITFFLLLLLTTYFGLSSIHLPLNDKFLHFTSLFVLTTFFYWILETSRRRIVNLTLLTITLTLGIGSEFLQPLINPKRPFDPYDILANILGSLSALTLMAWYHKRMLERKRLAKLGGTAASNSNNYEPVATDDEEGAVDLEEARRSSELACGEGEYAGPTNRDEHDVGARK